MRTRSSVLVLCALLVASVTQAAPPIVLTFEDLRTGEYAGLDTNYRGLTWSGDFLASGGTSGWAKAGYGPDCTGGGLCSPDYLPESPYMAVFTKNGTITFGAPTTFIGAWFSSQSNVALTYSYYSDVAMNALVSSFTETIEHTQPISAEFVSGPSTPIRTIKIDSPNTIWVMDDFTYCSPTAGDCGQVPIPEPATLGLLGLGLAGIARAARRRKK